MREVSIRGLEHVFLNEKARIALNPSTTVYRVHYFTPVPEGTSGGLFCGLTVIQPGMVDDEYFMTRGHLHANRERGECYLTIAGEGALLLMDEGRRTWFEAMKPGTIHYIPGHTAHRVANTGLTSLSFFACWPSDAGHDYESIARCGFSARLRKINGQPKLVEAP
ncbi:MAG TPA: glucose-6-phosphate isomerase family protein [Terriglobia bacterium]|nr:glucose-6-phosphate isomerase family protein [Terriglobia bacterium]